MDKQSHSYIFTHDWFTKYAPIWEHFLKPFTNEPHVRALEVGSFQGRSAVWMLENIMTHPTSQLTCIDTFEGSEEHKENEKDKLFEIFTHNIKLFEDRVKVFKAESRDILRFLPKHNYHIIYIDGDHHAASVLEDAVLAWYALKVGGVLIFDDYLWDVEEAPNLTDRPKLAIDSFINVFSKKLKVIHCGYQVMILKTSA
jgi:predicted O-methyltransferase YrrM